MYHFEVEDPTFYKPNLGNFVVLNFPSLSKCCAISAVGYQPMASITDCLHSYQSETECPPTILVSFPLVSHTIKRVFIIQSLLQQVTNGDNDHLKIIKI